MKTNVLVSLSQRSTVSVPKSSPPPCSRSGRSLPSGPSRPTRSGIMTGCFSGCPGVGGVRCVAVSVSVCLAAS